MAMRAMKAATLGVLAAATLGGFGAAIATERDASAAFFELGGEAGVQRRTLAGTDYKTDFSWQVHAELAFIPSVLQVGPYFGMQTAVPQLPTANTPKSVTFDTLGVRAKLRIPTGSPFTPYALIGFGWVHGNFPDQTITECAVPGVSATCASVKVVNATANFVEIPVGIGFSIQLADEVAINVEGAWRPTVGYTNDSYEIAIKNAEATGNTNPPPPSRNGYSFTAMGGLALTF
jgi:opacity protein-like surface antigen